jgi:uncharacterized HAD superfamily protein
LNIYFSQAILHSGAKMKIGFDFDSVITDSRKLKAEYAKKLYGLDLPYELFKWDPLVTSGKVTEEQYRAVQRAVHLGEQENQRMEPVAGVLEYLPKIMQEHDVKIVTARDGLSAELARRWLKENNLEIELLGVGNKVTKAAGCQGLDLFVDDDWDKLEPLIGVVPNRYLFTWEYNKHIDVAQSVAKRVHSWEEIYGIIQNLDVKV